MTDGNQGYDSLGETFKSHSKVKHGVKYFANTWTGAHINTAEAIGGLIERALVGVCHRLSRQRIQRYLDEPAWHCSRREPEEQIRTKAGREIRHKRWKPLPFPQMLSFLLSKPRGRQVRRSDYYGLRSPHLAFLGG